MEEEIYLGLLQRGLPPHVAQGIVMNMRDESGLNPGINEIAPTAPGSRGGYGLAQWTGPRRNALEQYASQSGRPLDDVDTQLDFLMTELRGPESRAYQSMMGTDDPGEAASAFATDFLRPAKQHLDRRVAEYQGQTPPFFPEPGENALRGRERDEREDNINALLAALDQRANQPPQTYGGGSLGGGTIMMPDLVGAYNTGRQAYLSRRA